MYAIGSTLVIVICDITVRLHLFYL